jgi:O-antigen/teichoic acid export membrane protein
MNVKPHILIKNVLYNFISQSWFFILAFFTTPYIVNKLGSDSYGVLSLVGVVLGYFAFLNFGLGPAVIKYISEYNAKKDYKSINKVIGSAAVFYLLIGVLGGGVILLLTKVIVNRLLKIPPQLIEVSYFAFYIGAAGFLINMLVSVVSSVLPALQRFDVANKIRIIIGTISILLTVLLLYSGYTLREIILLNLIISILSLIVYYIVCKKILPEFSFKPLFDKDIFKKLFHFGLSVLIAQISTTVVYELDKFLIGIFLPVSYITYYIIPFNIGQKILTVQGVVSPVVFPAVSDLSAEKLKDKIRELYIRSQRFIINLTLPLMIILIIFAKKFLFLWIGPDFAAKGTLSLQILMIGFFVTGLTSMPSSVSQGLNRPYIAAKFSFISAILSILFLLILIPLFGITCAAMTFSITNIILAPAFMYEINKMLGINNLDFIKKEFFYPSVISVFIIIALFFIKSIINNLVSLIFAGLIFFVVYLVLAYFLVFDEKDKKIINGYMDKIKRV